MLRLSSVFSPLRVPFCDDFYDFPQINLCPVVTVSLLLHSLSHSSPQPGNISVMSGLGLADEISLKKLFHEENNPKLKE